jgi:hypothetical protein
LDRPTTRRSALVPQSSPRVVRATFRDDGITFVFSGRKLIEGDTPIKITRENFSPEALEKVTEVPAARLAVASVLDRNSCVQRTDLDTFEIHTLLPRSGKTREKERIWRGMIDLFEELGYEVRQQDLRAHKARVRS